MFCLEGLSLLLLRQIFNFYFVCQLFHYKLPKQIVCSSITLEVRLEHLNILLVAACKFRKSLI